METMSSAKPVLKWAGGKRQLLPTIVPLLPETYGKYYEPFFGGGALYFEMQPKDAVIGDANIQLINMYEQIKDAPDEVCDILMRLQDEYNRRETIEDKDAFYYNRRTVFNEFLKNQITGDSMAAALFIFLNKAAFNGVYRVNSSGLYNVPSAHCKSLNIVDRENISAMSKQFQNTKIVCGDFADACSDAQKGDFVFFDSPYYDTWDTYQAGGFSTIDHFRLYELFDRLSKRGVYCMLTNNDCDFIRDLYKSQYNVMSVDVKRMINRNGNDRKGREIIVTNY